MSRVFDGATIGVCGLMFLLMLTAGGAWGGWMVATVLAVSCAMRGAK